MAAVRSTTTRIAAVCGAGAAVAAALVAVAPTGQATPAAGPTRDVLVVLRNQHAEAPATVAQIGHRRALLAADQAGLRTRIAALGARTTRTYAAVNALAASVPSGALTRIAADPAVAEVVPDLVWRAAPTGADPAAVPTTTAAAGSTAAATDDVCPADPSQPLLEPEALSLTHTASDDASATTARSLGYDGRGVKVGFIADGVDVNQPDYIRADGSHVFTDYQDFSGDGTAGSTSGAEALGDASSIAAQGRVTYDLSDFVNPAHPLPAGCTIRVQGIAPGASLVGLKVFNNALETAPTSTIVQAIDYAIAVDHVDVLNESFGSNPYPDDASDPISVLNHDAVDAGITVVASSGDAGAGNTMGTASTDPWVIAVGATTQFQSYAQTTRAGFQLGNGKWASNQPSSLSSSGISQTDRTMDLAAPGDLGWATCSDALLADGTPQYTGCGNYAGELSNLQLFGGTSESAPLTAGAAALVVQAYRGTHGGASPTPAQVRQALDSSADDLGLPAEDQGAGLLDTARAVQVAAAMAGGRPNGMNGLLVDRPYLSTTTTPGAAVSDTLTVTNLGRGTQRVSTATRRVDTVTAGTQEALTLDPNSTTNTFVDNIGVTRAYTRASFSVAPGTDRLVASVAFARPGRQVRLSLFDPQGTFSAYSLPQGVGGFGDVALQHPAAGTWTALVYTTAGSSGYSGPVAFRATSYAASSAGTVSPATFSLAPGASQTLTVDRVAPANGVSAASVVITSNGQTSTVPAVVDAVQPVSTTTPASFSGTFDEANARSFGPADTETYRFDVPEGASNLDLNLLVGGTTTRAAASSGVVAHLSDPSGEPLATVSNQHDEGGTTVTDPGIDIRQANPVAGVWQLTLELLNPVYGSPLPRPYQGTVSLDAAGVTSTGVPTGTATVSRTGGARATVTVTNTGPAPQTYFLDPRTSTVTTYPLVATQDATRDPFTAQVAVPLASETVPAWIVPTGSTRLSVTSSATEPTTFDLMPLDNPTAINAPSNPDTEATVSGNGASAVHTASPIASALWAAFPSVIGPIPAGGAPAGTVTMQATVDTLGFDGDVQSTTGDPLRATVQAVAGPGKPVTVAPGQSVTIAVRILPTAAAGAAVTGTLYLDVLVPGGAAGFAAYAVATAALPYAYTVAP